MLRHFSDVQHVSVAAIIMKVWSGVESMCVYVENNRAKFNPDPI